MRHCYSCLRALPTRWDKLIDRLVMILILIVGLSVGYLLRDSVFLKRENTMLSGLLDSYVRKIEVDKVVDHNVLLKGQNQALRTKRKGE